MCPLDAAREGSAAYASAVKIALIDSGIGLLAAATAVRALRPETDLVLSADPDGVPWGPRTPRSITSRALLCARAAAACEPRALIVACNTASVHALPALRARFEPTLPVIGTVPAIKPAAAKGGRVAVWATPATTSSPYQRRLIKEFGGGAEVTPVPCHGLADAVERADEEAIEHAISAAARLTPAGVSAVVLGCTHYELVAERIQRAVHTPGTPLPSTHGSAHAVAAQALRRAAEARGPAVPPLAATLSGGGEGNLPAGTLTVLASGREADVLSGALSYAEGRLLHLTQSAPASFVRPDAQTSARATRT